MDGRRREEDVGELERRAEANWIAERLSGRGRDGRSSRGRSSRSSGRIASTCRCRRRTSWSSRRDEDSDVDGAATGGRPTDELDRDPDEMPDEVRDDGRRGADEDLART